MSAWTQRFDAEVSERAPRLWAYAYALTGRESDADRLLFHALVTAFSGRLPRDDATLALRMRQQLWRAFLADGDTDSRHPRPAAASSVIPGAPVPAHSEEATDRFHQALLALPARERLCVLLRAREGMSVASLALETGLEPGDVRSDLRSAQAALGAYAQAIDLSVPTTDDYEHVSVSVVERAAS